MCKASDFGGDLKRLSKIWTSILGVLLLVGGLQARAETCQHRIVFLPQVHDSTYTKSPAKDIEAIARSQCNIAKYIDQRPDLPVFSEQVAEEDYAWRKISNAERAVLTKVMKTTFPKGLPPDCSSLSQIESQKFVDNGADFIQLMRQKIPVIHRVLKDAKQAKDIFGPVDAWFNGEGKLSSTYSPAIKKLVFDAREQGALDQINEFFKTHPKQQDVILMFGDDHDFSHYPERFPPACVVVPDAFKTGLLSARRGQPVPSAATGSVFGNLMMMNSGAAK